jgi:uncharacterized protein YidB (DUF937 family)
MSLLDQLKGILGEQGGDSNVEASGNNLLESAMGLLNSPQIGGIAGLTKMFNDSGMSEAVSSWVSMGKNLPISPEQVQSVLGEQQVQQIAGKMGISNQNAASGLAAMLPQIIDAFTPDGKVPEGNNSMMEMGMEMLKQQFFGKK